MRAALQRSASRTAASARMMSGKDIKFGVEGRAAMLRGVDLLADAVQVSGRKRYHSVDTKRFPHSRFCFYVNLI